MPQVKTIIIKKKGKVGAHGFHGGNWKIAYADFVTAMMVFFMVLWMINMTSEDHKKAIANYFSHNLASMQSTNGSKGLLSGNSAINPNGSHYNNFESEEEYHGSIHKQVEHIFKQKMPTTQGVTEKVKKKLGHHKTASPKTADIPEQAGDQAGYQAGHHIAHPDHKNFEKIVQMIQQKLQDDPQLRHLAHHVVTEMRPEGLRLQIVDHGKFAMFPSGSSDPVPEAKALLKMVAHLIESLPNPIVISGHTDDHPFTHKNNLHKKKYSNWELSTDRAHMARRTLMDYGISAKRFSYVVGLAATEPLLTNDPGAAMNRRISVTLLRT